MKVESFRKEYLKVWLANDLKVKFCRFLLGPGWKFSRFFRWFKMLTGRGDPSLALDLIVYIEVPSFFYGTEESAVRIAWPLKNTFAHLMLCDHTFTKKKIFLWRPSQRCWCRGFEEGVGVGRRLWPGEPIIPMKRWTKNTNEKVNQ